MSPKDPDPWLLPDEDFRFSLGIQPGEPAHYFGPSPDQARLLAERRRWLTEDPDRYVAALPNVEHSLAEIETRAVSWGYVPACSGATRQERLLDLGRQLEPDLVLMVPDASGRFLLAGGCVCFPSYWRLTDKLGLPLDAVHAPVPGLNATIGPSIDRYLSRLKPGGCWFRTNWGLARQGDLNEHPDLGRSEWQRPLSLHRVWLRRENQAILSLPASGSVLFGIRVIVCSLHNLVKSPDNAHRLARAVRTMSAEMAAYKGFDTIRSELLRLLAGDV